jgi:hypothetical protein
MMRCPSCGEATPEKNVFCPRCGISLSRPQAPSFTPRQWLDPFSLFRSALVALQILCLYGIIFSWAFYTLPRSESRILAYHLCLGLALSLGVGFVRRINSKEYPWWFLMGLVVGTFAYLADFLYNYQHLIYRLVFFVADRVDPVSSVIVPFRVLQALRFFIACAVLSWGLYQWEGSWRSWLWYLACAVVGAYVRAWVRGWPLATGAFGFMELPGGGEAWVSRFWDPQDWLRLRHLFLYFFSLWVVLYGFGRKSPRSLKRFSS